MDARCPSKWDAWRSRPTASALVTFGETMVLVTAVADKKAREGDRFLSAHL